MSFLTPVLMSQIGTVTSVVGSAVSAISGMQQASYQAAVAERNRQIMEQNARAEIEASQREQQDWGVSAKGQLGQLAAELAASGVRGGSAALRQTGAGLLARRDAERISEEGRTRANANYQAAADAAATAAQARSARRYALFSGLLNMADSYISGSTQTRLIKKMIK